MRPPRPKSEYRNRRITHAGRLRLGLVAIGRLRELWLERHENGSWAIDHRQFLCSIHVLLRHMERWVQESKELFYLGDKP